MSVKGQEFPHMTARYPGYGPDLRRRTAHACEVTRWPQVLLGIPETDPLVMDGKAGR